MWIAAPKPSAALLPPVLLITQGPAHFVESRPRGPCCRLASGIAYTQSLPCGPFLIARASLCFPCPALTKTAPTPWGSVCTPQPPGPVLPHHKSPLQWWTFVSGETPNGAVDCHESSAM